MGEPALKLVPPVSSDNDAKPVLGTSAGRPTAAASLWRTVGKPANTVANKQDAEGANNEGQPANNAATNADVPANNGANNEVPEAPADEAAKPPAKAAGTPDKLPELALPGRPMTTGEHLTRIARQRLAQTRKDLMHPGELAHSIVHGKPESLAELHAYTVYRAWLDGHPGGKRDALNAFYLHTVAKGGTALLLGAMWVIQRFTRLAVAVTLLAIITVLFIAFG